MSNLTTDDVARVFDLPPHLLSELQTGTYGIDPYEIVKPVFVEKMMWWIRTQRKYAGKKKPKRTRLFKRIK
jgi:hypothetical protein